MKAKTEIDIEKLLHWAYRDELSKRQTSAAEGIWDRLRHTAQLGGLEPGHGSAQRYAHFGLPDADAETIERAVAALESVVIDWSASMPTIAAGLTGLVTINDLQRRATPGKVTVSTWGAKNGARVKAENRPRDVLMLGTLRPAALVTQHAIRANRPDWFNQEPRPQMVPALKGPNARIEGECKGRNLYSTGSYCPLQWEPSPASVILARADYAAWWNGLNTLADSLVLDKFIALHPTAPPTPWIEPDEPEMTILHVPTSPFQGSYGLTPERPRAGPPLRMPKAGPARELGRAESY